MNIYKTKNYFAFILKNVYHPQHINRTGKKSPIQENIFFIGKRAV
jgi:hypothetical protein